MQPQEFCLVQNSNKNYTSSTSPFTKYKFVIRENMRFSLVPSPQNFLQSSLIVISGCSTHVSVLLLLQYLISRSRYLFLKSSGICSSDEHVQRRLAPIIRKLANGYYELYCKQKQSKTLKKAKKDEFFGLRDFYRYVVL